MKSRLKKLRLGALIILFGSGFLSIIINILIAFSPLPQLHIEEQKALQNLQAYRLDISKLAFINDRGNNIRKILSKRTSYDKNIAAVQNKIPPNVSFDGFTINNKNYTFKFSGNNLQNMDELLNSLMSMTGKGKDYIKIYLTSLSIDEQNHNFVMVIDLLTV